jgi:hypothetical protein
MMKGRMVAVLIRRCCGCDVDKPLNDVVDVASAFPGAFSRVVKLKVDLLYDGCLVSKL